MYGFSTCADLEIKARERKLQVSAMSVICITILFRMLHSLSVQELKDVYGLVALQVPWAVVELTIHAMLIRRLTEPDEAMFDLCCIEFFAGNFASSQIAKAFGELGLRAYAFDVSRISF